jgi:hypothetical protein
LPPLPFALVPRAAPLAARTARAQQNTYISASRRRLRLRIACLRFACNETSAFVLTFFVLAIPSNGA